MSSYPFDWVDAFTDQPFGGNGCAVVYDEGALDVETCLRFTRETGLVECTFIGPSDVADLRVRYFLAEREIPFAGHPTIASAVSALSRGRVAEPEFRFETGAGVVPITVSNGSVQMIQPRPEFGQVVEAAIVAPVIGLEPGDILGQPQVVSTGLPFCVTHVKDHDALRRAVLNVEALGRFRSLMRHRDADVMEPYLIALGGATQAGDSFARLLLAPPNPAEDPFTGSATGCAAAYLWRNRLIDQPDYLAEQGHWMGRPGQAQVTVLGPPEDIAGIRVSGQGRIVMRGEMLP